jgi:hypothetical protein
MTVLFIINWTRENVFDTKKIFIGNQMLHKKICPIYAFYIHFYGNFHDIDGKHSKTQWIQF